MLIISLFVLVVMAVLAVAMNRMLSSASDTLVYEVYGLRALQAARSGLETRLIQIFPLGGAVNGASCDNTPSTQVLGGEGLEHCEYRHQCSQQVYDVDKDGVVDDPDDVTYFRLTSTGICQAGETVASRTLSVDARVGS
ncbi:type II secretory pathway protein [Bowmanella dokdonensis]|nr:type II secretory pathway protein [Bowmanella dokdonensis]